MILRLFSRLKPHCTRLVFGLNPGLNPALNPCVPRLIAIGALIVACLFLSCAAYAQASPSPLKDKKWRLTWSDEFNGPNGSGVDPSKWVVEVGGKDWGNEELEYYTSRPENAYIQDSNLVIKARRENYTGTDGLSRNYTSARLKSAGVFASHAKQY